MLRVPWPESIEPLPLVMLQEYLAPFPAVGTDAVFRVEPAQTVAGALIVVSGFTRTRADPLEVPVHTSWDNAITE